MMCGVEADIPTPGTQAQRPHGLSGRLIGNGRLLGDERLAQAAGAGNEGAFTTLFQRYHQQLYRYCRGLTGSDQDAQDALQTAFTKALIALREGRRNAPLRPWLYRIAHNESISVLRGRSAAVADLPFELASSQGVSDSAEQRERMAMLISDLRELPEQQRGALVMRELSGLSHEEIAAALQVSVGAAKQSILEARRSLLEFAEGRAMRCEAIQRIISDDDRRSLRSRRVRAHLRDCGTCAALAEAIPRRRAEMLALWPALPAASAAGMLSKITAGAGSGHGGGGAGLAAGTAAKGIGATISIKAATAAGVAVIATAGAGAVAVIHHGASPQIPLTRSVASGGATGAGHGPPAARGITHRPRGGSNHRAATGTGPGAPAGHRAAGHGSHAGGTAGRGSAQSSNGSGHGSHGHGGRGPTGPAGSSNHGHSATVGHHGSSRPRRSRPLTVSTPVHRRTRKRVVYHRVTPKRHRVTVVKRATHTVTRATHTVTRATHTVTRATHTVTRATHTVTAATHTVTAATTTVTTRTRTTASTPTRTTVSRTTTTRTKTTTTAQPTTTSAAPTTTTVAATTVVSTSGSSATGVPGGQGNGGGAAVQPAGSPPGNKNAK
jgi:RNA polymerase sigma factor (sigma-70 family)